MSRKISRRWKQRIIEATAATGVCFKIKKNTHTIGIGFVKQKNKHVVFIDFVLSHWLSFSFRFVFKLSCGDHPKFVCLSFRFLFFFFFDNRKKRKAESSGCD